MWGEVDLSFGLRLRTWYLCTGPFVFPTLSGMRELGLEKLSGSTVALC